MAYRLPQNAQASSYINRIRARNMNSLGEDAQGVSLKEKQAAIQRARYRKYADNARIKRLRSSVMQYQTDHSKSYQPKRIIQQKQPTNQSAQKDSSQDKTRYLKNQGFKFNIANNHSFRSKNVR